jgi:hypothetical protein
MPAAGTTTLSHTNAVPLVHLYGDRAVATGYSQVIRPVAGEFQLWRMGGQPLRSRPNPERMADDLSHQAGAGWPRSPTGLLARADEP